MGTLMSSVSRLRMFGGPNGSGKSAVKSVIRRALLGVYLNPDEIESEISHKSVLNLNTYGIQTDQNELLAYFR
jgi:predicted ABC-type ATPase